jgi:hypothetical protein
VYDGTDASAGNLIDIFEELSNRVVKVDFRSKPILADKSNERKTTRAFILFST